MLKIAKSLVVILGISVLAVGATSALFTDQKTIANNKKPIKLVWNDFVENRDYWMSVISVAQFEMFCESLKK